MSPCVTITQLNPKVNSKITVKMFHLSGALPKFLVDHIRSILYLYDKLSYARILIGSHI